VGGVDVAEAPRQFGQRGEGKQPSDGGAVPVEECGDAVGDETPVCEFCVGVVAELGIEEGDGEASVRHASGRRI